MNRARAGALAALPTALGLALTGAGCGAGTAARPATVASRPQVVALVAEDPAALAGVEVSAGTSRMAVPASEVVAIAPLVSDRALSGAEPPSAYGLDHPPAVLDYRARDGSTAVIDLGHPDFDRHFIYAQRAGDPRIFLLPAGPLRPVLSLVGLTVPPPT